MVFAGTMNLWGAVEALVLRPVAESSLQRIIRLIKEAQHQKAPAQQFTDKFGTFYTYAVLSLSFAMFFVWWLAMDLPAFTSKAAAHSAFYRAMTLLVVASPCALVLSIPQQCWRNCLERPARYPVPRRRCGRETRRRHHGSVGQNRHTDYRGIAR